MSLNRNHLNRIVYDINKEILGILDTKELVEGKIYNIYYIIENFLGEHLDLADTTKAKEVIYLGISKERKGDGYLYHKFKEISKNKYFHTLSDNSYKLSWYCMRKSSSK